MSVVGCTIPSAITRKFIRKKTPIIPAIAITTRTYAPTFTPEERYQHHFRLWTFWYDELQEGLGTSRKKALRATDEAVGELRALQELLVPEKAAHLEPPIQQLERFRRDLHANVLSPTALERWVHDLERTHRLVHREFTWKAAHDFVVEGTP